MKSGNMNLFNIENAYCEKIERGWDTIYWLIDAHNVIFPGLYDITQDYIIYPEAKPVLQFLSKCDDVYLILYTCSHQNEIERMLNTLGVNNIYIHDINQNIDVPNTELGDYTQKLYCNIILDDKAGFEVSDWNEIQILLRKIYNAKK